MTLNPIKIVRSRFGLKVFLAVFLLIFVISSSFTALFIYVESKSHVAALMKNGELLAKILARNVRLGVFAENRGLIKESVSGALQQQDVLEVSVFNSEGELLDREKKGRSGSFYDEAGKGIKIPGVLREAQSVISIDRDDTLECWSRVLSSVDYPVGDVAFLEESIPGKRPMVIGFIRVLFDKRRLNSTLATLLKRGLLLGFLFLIISSCVTYVMVGRIVRPINRLTEGVKALGRGGEAGNMPVDKQDEIGRLAEAFNDMAESLKKREAEKEQLEQLLRQAHKMEAIGTLAGGIAHDFNNILSVIIGNATLLEMQIETGTPSKDHLKQVLVSAERAANLTKNLLMFSRQKIIETKTIDLNNTIEEIRKLLARLIREDIRFEVVLAEEELLIRGDSGQIGQVLMNLVTNATDAMPDGGVLTITTESVELEKDFFKAHSQERPGRYALLSVSDTGGGIDEEIMDRIFDPFFTTKETGKGTGLGLAMAYGIVKQHDGYIDVESVHNRGTSFRIYLPLIDSVEEEEEENPRHVHRPVYGSETVLVGEDDEGVRALSREVLEQHGYRVIEAVDGEDSVRKFVENKEIIDILLLDVVMPRKNGRMVYEEIRAIRPDIKVLFMSGYTSDIMEEKGVDMDEVALINKPVSPSELLKRLREALDGD